MIISSICSIHATRTVQYFTRGGRHGRALTERSFVYPVPILNDVSYRVLLLYCNGTHGVACSGTEKHKADTMRCPRRSISNANLSACLTDRSRNIFFASPVRSCDLIARIATPCRARETRLSDTG